LSRSGRKPSAGVHLLAAFKSYFAENHATEVTSETFVAHLTADPISTWKGYNRGGSITQRQVANLLDAYGIHPISLHPTKRKDFSRQGYKLSQFSDAFERYLPRDPIIQSPNKQQLPNKQRSPNKQRKRVKDRKRR
jgi:hypothetical protein